MRHRPEERARDSAREFQWHAIAEKTAVLYHGPAGAVFDRLAEIKDAGQRSLHGETVKA